MWLKTFIGEMRELIKSSYKLLISFASVILAARLILSGANSAVANNGKPPFIATAVSYAGYAASAITFAVLVILALVSLRRGIFGVLTDNENGDPVFTVYKITSAALSAFLFCLSGYLFYILGYTVLSLGESYFDLIFHNLIPPLGYSATDYGKPMILYTILSVSLLILSLILSISFAFVFSAKRKQKERFTVICMLGFYAVALILFIILIMSNVPPAEVFSGYMYSGSYSNVISAYLAAAISASIPAISSFPFALLYAAKTKSCIKY